METGYCGWPGPAEQLALGDRCRRACNERAPGWCARDDCGQGGRLPGRGPGGARLGTCSGSGAGRRAPRGAGKGQICETGWARPRKASQPHWVVGLCPKATGAADRRDGLLG